MAALRRLEPRPGAGVVPCSLPAEVGKARPDAGRAQNLESRGLDHAQALSSSGNTRLYSQEEVVWLDRLRASRSSLGSWAMNLAGVGRSASSSRDDGPDCRRDEAWYSARRPHGAQMRAAVERISRSCRFELVPYERPERHSYPGLGRREDPIRRAKAPKAGVLQADRFTFKSKKHSRPPSGWPARRKPPGSPSPAALAARAGGSIVCRC